MATNCSCVFVILWNRLYSLPPTPYIELVLVCFCLFVFFVCLYVCAFKFSMIAAFFLRTRLLCDNKDFLILSYLILLLRGREGGEGDNVRRTPWTAQTFAAT